MARLTFLGAARTVTGSQYLVEAGAARLMVDCGMGRQGPCVGHFSSVLILSRSGWAIRPSFWKNWGDIGGEWTEQFGRGCGSF